MTLPSASQWHVPPPLPWKPLLTAAQLRRGLSFYGSGARIERVAARLLAGQPITAVTVGGSVTRGAGASKVSKQYPEMFFQFIQSTFPHRQAMPPPLVPALPPTAFRAADNMLPLPPCAGTTCC